MSRFYGTIDGAPKNQVTARGHTFVTTHAASWNGAVRVHLYLTGDVEMCEISLVKWNGAGTNHVIYRGPVDKYQPMDKGH